MAGTELTVEQLVSKLQHLVWQGKGHYKVIAEGMDKPRYFTADCMTVHEGARLVDLLPHGRHAHHDLPNT